MSSAYDEALERIEDLEEKNSTISGACDLAIKDKIRLEERVQELESWILAAATPPSSRPFDGIVNGKSDLWQMAYENIRSWRNSGFCAMFWEPERGWKPIRIEMECQGHPFYRLTDGTAHWEMIKEWETRARLNAETQEAPDGT